MEPLFGLPPILWNMFTTFIVFVYIMSIIKFMDFLVTKGFPQDVSRKIVHVAAGSWVIFWPLFCAKDLSYVLNIAVAVLWTILFIVKGLTASSEDYAVKTMTRSGDPKELLRGPLFFTLVMEVLGVFFFMNYAAVVTMAILGWGDGLAPLIGKYYGRRKYKLLGREKTIEGSLGMFLFGFLGSLILVFVVQPIGMPQSIESLILSILIACLIGTIVEAISPADIDNILIPIATMIYLLFAL